MTVRSVAFEATVSADSTIGAMRALPVKDSNLDTSDQSAVSCQLDERGLMWSCEKCPQRDSNPRSHLERVESLTARRWGRHPGSVRFTHSLRSEGIPIPQNATGI